VPEAAVQTEAPPQRRDAARSSMRDAADEKAGETKRRALGNK
jgi:hypothetical protein